MTDWAEAGRKADAHRIRDLYRQNFDSPVKAVARKRVAEALRAVGGSTVLDLWGGGLSANYFTSQGFRVIFVDDGSLILDDRGRPVSSIRKRRALERTAAEDGYEARWGKVQKFAAEADVAFLDFCGPWSKEVRRAVHACRHMKAVVITLMPDHDMSTDATSRDERRVAYEAFLHMAYGGVATVNKGVYRRRLGTYARDGGQRVFFHMVAKVPINLRKIGAGDIAKLRRSYMSPGVRAAERARSRAYYHLHKHELNISRAEQSRIRRATDPVAVARERHYYHVKVSRFFSYCEFCKSAGQHLPPGRLERQMLTG